MGWNDHFLNAGEDEYNDPKEPKMSHSDMAIDEQQKEEFFQTMRDSADYKFGYCRSAITTAIWLLELGKNENALSCLKSCAEMMKEKTDAR